MPTIANCLPPKSSLTRLLSFLLAPFLLALAPAVAQAQVDLVLNVSDAPDPVPRTGLVTYTVVTENNGLTTATGVRDTVKVPSGTTYEGFTVGDGASCSGMSVGQAGPGEVVCTLPDLAFGASAAFTLQLRLANSGSTFVDFVAAADQPEPPPRDEDNRVTNRTTVVAGADVSIALTSPFSTYASGSAFSYTLSLTNAGPDVASALTVQLPIPSGFTQLGSLPSGCSSNGVTITCTVSGSIGVGATRVIGDIPGKITVSAGSNITATASVAVQPGAPPLTPQDPNTDNNTAVNNILVTAGSDVRLRKARSVSGSLFQGDSLDFVLTPRYDGDVPIGLTITDTVPANYLLGAVPASQNGWSCSVSPGQVVTCTQPGGPPLVPGYNQPLGTIRIPVLVQTAGTGIVNRAHVAASGPFDPDLGNNQAADAPVNLLVPSADLSLTKSGPVPPLAVVGVPFEWTLRVANGGPSGFSGELIVVDTLPLGVTVNGYTLNGWSCSNTAPSNPVVVTCSRNYVSPATLASGASTSVVLDVTATVAGTLQNRAALSTVGASVPDQNPGNNNATHTVTASIGGLSADLAVLKTATPKPVAAGEPLTYRLTVINFDTTTATNVTLADTLTTLVGGAGGYVGYTIVRQGVAAAFTCQAPGYSSGVRFNCLLPSLPQCDSLTDCPIVDVTVLPGGNGGARINRARAISADVADPNLANNSGADTTTVLARADITVTKTDTPDPVAAGQPLTYVIAAINNGPSQATTVQVIDTLPLGVYFTGITAANWSCTTPTVNTVTDVGNRVVSCSTATINSGAQRTVSIVVRPTNATIGGLLTNTARVSTATTEPPTPGATNNVAVATTAVIDPSFDLLVNKVDTVDPLSVDSLTVYRITVNNAGPSDAEDIRVLDSLPAAGLSFVSVSPAAGCSTIPVPGTVGGVLDCTIARLNAAASTEFEVTMRGVAKGIYTNRVRVGANGAAAAFEADSVNNVAVQSTTVRTRADMQVSSKVATPDPAALRRPFSWNITLVNRAASGLAEADSVRLTDTLPAGMELTGTPTVAVRFGTTVAGSCTGVAGGTLFSCVLGTVFSGDTLDITVPVRQLTAPAGGTITNTARVSTSSLDVNPANNGNSGSVGITSSSLSGLVFRDFDEDSLVDPGDTGVGGVEMTVSGLAFDNSPVNRTVLTLADGTFTLDGLPEGTYTVRRGAFSETYLSVGRQTAGTSGGDAGTPPDITGVALGEGVAAGGYLYALIPESRLGIAKRVVGTPLANADGSLSAVLRLRVQNYSREALTAVTITDPLAGAAPLFGSFVPGGAAAVLTAGSYTIEAAPSIAGLCAGAVPNPAFDGDATLQVAQVPSLAAGVNGAPGAACEFDFTLRYQPTAPLPPGNYSNQAFGTSTGSLSGGTYTDSSQVGNNADPDGNLDPRDNNAPTPLGAVLAADVETAVSFPPTVDAGEPVNGTVRFANRGPYTAEDVTYTLTLAPNLTNVAFTNLPAGVVATYTPGTGVVTFTNMPVTLSPNAIASGDGTNPIGVSYTQNGVANSTVTSGIGTSSNEGQNTGPNSATATVLGNLIVDVTTALAFPDSVNAGQTVSGTVRFSNAGPSTAADMTYGLTLSPGLTGVSFGNLPAGAGASYDPGTGVVTFTNMPATLAAGAIASGNGTSPITVDYTQNGTASSAITSSVGTSTSQGVNAAPDTAAAAVAGNLIADVTTTMAFPVSVDAGQPVNGTIRFENTGPSVASGMTYSMTLTPGLTGVTFGNLPVGASATYDPVTGLVTFSNMPATLAVGALASGNGTSGITLGYVQPGTAVSNITSTIGTSTDQGANVALDNAAASPGGGLIADVRALVQAPPTVDAGETVNATVSFSNLGPSPAADVGYTLTLTAGLTNVLFGNLPSGATASYDAGTGVVTFTGMPTSLAANALASGNGTSGITLSYTQNALANSTITGGISTSTSQGANVAPDSDTRTVLGDQIADVTTALTGFPPTVPPGQPVTGELLFRNAGPSASAGTTYGLQLAPGLTGVVFSNLPVGAGATYDPGTGVVTFTNMPVTVPPGTIVSGDGVNGIGITYTQGTVATTISSTIGTTTSQGANALPDTASTTVASLVPTDLAVTKTTVSTSAAPGDTITYRLRVTNNGPVAVTGSSYLQDTPSAGLTLVALRCAAESGNQCVAAPAVSTLVNGLLLPPLGVGDVYALSVDAVVSAAIGSTVSNRALVRVPPGFIDSDSTNNTAEAGPLPVTGRPDLAITKRLTGPLVAGQQARYELSVQNVGSAPTADVITITDALPTPLTFASATGAGWSCAVTGQDVSCDNPGPLAPGATSTVALDVTVSALATGSVLNRAIVRTGGDVVPGNDTSSVSAPVTLPPDLAVSKRATLDSLTVGDTADYRVRILNAGAGPTTAPIELVDDLPAGLLPVSAEGDGFTCTISGQRVSCARQLPLAPGDSVTLTVSATVGSPLAGSTVRNTACASTAGDPNTANDCGEATTPVATQAEAELEKMAVSPFSVGGTGTFRLVTHNRGARPLTGPLTVRDSLPAGLTFVSAAGAGWTCNELAGVVSCGSAGPVAVGDSSVITLEVLVGPDALPEVTNCATLQAPTGTLLRGAGRACATVPTANAPNIETRKTVNVDTARVGGPVQWTIAIANTGTAATTAPIVMTDSLPPAVSYTGASGDGFSCSIAGQVLRCERAATLAVGDTVDIVVNATVRADAPLTPLLNRACSRTAGDLRPADDCDQVETPVAGRQEGELLKEAVGEFLVGQPGAFRLRVRNSGTVPLAAPISVVDTLPNGLTFLSATGAGWSCSASGPVVTCTTNNTLAVGDSAAVTVNARIGTAALPAFTNCATLSLPGGGASPAARSCATVEPTTDYRLVLELTTPRYLRELSDVPDFTVLVRNVGRSPLPNVVITNLLPAGFTYVPGSSVRGGRPDNTARAPIADPSGGTGPTIAWPVGDMEPGQVIRVDYRALIRLGASFNVDNITISTAESNVPGLVVTSNTATVPIRLQRGLFDTRGMIAGKVYLQCDCDTLPGQQDGEVGVPGVRVLLEDGTSAITDSEGKYNLLDVRAGLHVVKIDRTTLPAGADLQLLNARNAGDPGSRFVDLKAGELHRADFPALAADDSVLRAVLQRRRLGEVSVLQVPSMMTNGAGAGLRAGQGTGVLPGGGTGDAGGVRRVAGMPSGTASRTTANGSVSTYRPLVAARGLHDGNSNLPPSAVRAAAQLTGQPADSAVTVTDSVLVVPSRPLVAAGLVQGRIDLRSLSRGGLDLAAIEDGFEDRLRDVSLSGDSGRVRAGARGALLLKGDIKGAGLFTLAFDSERDPARTQFRDISPETGFPLFGDASIREFDAQSQQRLYAQLDRGASFVRYGDFATPRADDRRLLLAYDRSLTGLSVHAEGERGVFNGFASRNGIRQVIDEVPGRGLSGPYYLTRANAVINSERVELLTRDRNQPAVILRREPMRRFEDYVIEPYSGRLLFRAPVPSLDANLNPITIRVSYETEQAGEMFFTYGGDATVRVASGLELGAFAVRDANPLDEQTLFGASGAARLGVGTTLIGELARTDVGDQSVTGGAWRLELRHASQRVEGRVFAMRSDSTFGNRSSTFLGGRDEYGARVSATLDTKTRLIGEAMRTEDIRTEGRRNGVLLAVERRLTSRLLGEVGYRWADENGAGVSPTLPGSAGGLFGGTTGSVGNALTPLSFSAARARLSARLPGSERSSVFAEYEHGLDSDAARRGVLGGEYLLFDRARAYLRHEWISSTQGPYALAEDRSQQNTVFGIDADYARDAQVFSEYRARDAFSGRDAEASIGLRNRWAVSPGVRLNTSFERVTPLSGVATGEAYAATAAVELAQSALWKGTARLEWRSSPTGDNLLGSVGYARKLSRDWTLLGRSLWDQLTDVQLRGRSQLGVAWRETDRNRVNALFRLENRLDQADALGEPTTRSMSNVAVALVNVQPDPSLTLSLRYAGKFATDRRDETTTSSRAQLVMGRAIYDVSHRLDVGAIGSVLGNESFAERRYGVGVELGVVVVRNLRLAGGYNLFGFTDRDFESLGYTQRGPYLEFGFKFDESFFGRGGNTP